MIAKHVLVTGANGFVGNHLCRYLIKENFFVRGTVRNKNSSLPNPGVDYVEIGSIGEKTDWRETLAGIDTVIHLAARVHQMSDGKRDTMSDYHIINTMGTERLSMQAVAAGVRRFIFLSTIKVNGQSNMQGHSFSEIDKPYPTDAYARSKHEAEQRLNRIARQSKMDVVIIRPPLVYGPGVKANFLVMMRWLRKGVPLPLGAINNRRSLVALDNLLDFILICCQHPAAVNQTFFVSDGNDMSTTALLEATAAAMQLPARLIPVPEVTLKVVAALLGKRAIAQRLCESLQVDVAKARDVLSWRPKISVEDGIRRTVDWYLETLQ